LYSYWLIQNFFQKNEAKLFKSGMNMKILCNIYEQVAKMFLKLNRFSIHEYSFSIRYIGKQFLNHKSICSFNTIKLYDLNSNKKLISYKVRNCIEHLKFVYWMFLFAKIDIRCPGSLIILFRLNLLIDMIH
jgi:hypothetical protein